MHAMAKMAKNRQTAGDLNWMPKVAPWRGRFWRKFAKNSVKLVVCLVCVVFRG